MCTCVEYSFDEDLVGIGETEEGGASPGLEAGYCANHGRVLGGWV